MALVATHPGGSARIIYMGSPAIAVEPLRRLVEAGHEVVLVISNPDRRRGRGKELTATPVKAAAIELGLPVSDTLGDALSVDADLGVVVAYGHLIGSDILDALPLVNIHFSLLPRWRGAAPLERAILAGDRTTGVCLMQITEGLDEGAVYARSEIEIGERTLEELADALVHTSCELLIDALAHGFGTPIPQVGEPVVARKLRSDDFAIDWADTAEQVLRVVRLGRAYTTLDGRRFAIGRARIASPDDLPDGLSAQPVGTIDGTYVATADGVVELIEVQPEGKRSTPATDWANGARVNPGTVLGA